MDHQIMRNFSSKANDAYKQIQYDKGMLQIYNCLAWL